MRTDGWPKPTRSFGPWSSPRTGSSSAAWPITPSRWEESIAQAKAAASRALTVLAKDHIMVGGVVSHIREELCSGCLGCINVCPYGAVTFDEERNAARVNAALCKGCGACAAACPSEAPVLMGFNNQQLYAQIKSALAG